MVGYFLSDLSVSFSTSHTIDGIRYAPIRVVPAYIDYSLAS